jgi:hypothetical protein
VTSLTVILRDKVTYLDGFLLFNFSFVNSAHREMTKFKVLPKILNKLKLMKLITSILLGWAKNIQVGFNNVSCTAYTTRTGVHPRSSRRPPSPTASQSTEASFVTRNIRSKYYCSMLQLSTNNSTSNNVRLSGLLPSGLYHISTKFNIKCVKL